MQIDMHYYGTYAMARAAGLTDEVCKIIATAAQFVDDNAKRHHIKFKDGARLDLTPTAHHTTDIDNLDEEDQFQVWVPFHFLPGNEGDGYTERLMCRKDSVIANECIDHHIERSDQAFSCELMGLLAHVYADTFSHYDFVGVATRWNEIEAGSLKYSTKLDPDLQDYIEKKNNKFFAKLAHQLVSNVKAYITDKVPLGHGTVSTYPDRPYLTWSFNRKIKNTLNPRPNQETFLEGCEKLYGLFERFADARPDYREFPTRPFADIKDLVKSVLDKPGKCEDRIQNWQVAARAGRLFPSGTELIPTYNGEAWHDSIKNLDNTEDSRLALKIPAVRFYQDRKSVV